MSFAILQTNLIFSHQIQVQIDPEYLNNSVCFQIDLDLAELNRLSELAERPNVKRLLTTEIEKLKGKLTPREAVPESKVLSSEPVAPPATQRATVTPVKYYKDITTYGRLIKCKLHQ